MTEEELEKREIVLENKTRKVRKSEFHNCFTNWAVQRGFIKSGGKPTINKLTAKIKSLNFPVVEKVKDGYHCWQFNPKEVYEFLKKKKWVEIENDEKEENNEEGLSKDELDDMFQD